MFATRKNKNKIQINKRNTSIDLKEERWQSFFVLPTCTRINRPKQNRNSYVIQANDCRALFANCLVNKHMQRNLSAATLSWRNEKRRSHYEESNWMSNTRFIFSILVTFAGSRNRENASNHKSSADVAKKKEKKKQFPNRNKQILKLKVFQNALALLFRIPLFFFFIIDFYWNENRREGVGSETKPAISSPTRQTFPPPPFWGATFSFVYLRILNADLITAVNLRSVPPHSPSPSPLAKQKPKK